MKILEILKKIPVLGAFLGVILPRKGPKVEKL